MPNYGKIPKTLQRVVRKEIVRGAIGPLVHQKELKYFDYPVVGTAGGTAYDCTVTGTIQTINIVEQGDSNTRRNGRQIEMKSVHVMGFFNPQAAAGPAANYIRLALVWDNAVNSGATISTATYAEIWTAVDETKDSATDVAPTNSLAMTKVENENRFTILCDERIALGPHQGTTINTEYGTPSTFAVDKYYELNLPTQFTNDGTSIQNGGLIFVTKGTSAAGTGHDFYARIRCRFVDP